MVMMRSDVEEIKNDGVFKVLFPSGKVLEISGYYLLLGHINGEFAVCITDIKESFPVNIIDPRVIIYSDDVVVYNGRDHYDVLSADMKKWMDENKDWPERVLGKKKG